jgi:Condensin complex subunit 2
MCVAPVYDSCHLAAMLLLSPHRRSDAVKASLCDAFSGGADQAGADAALTLPTEALSAMFEQCIRLAAENKISERNVWQLDLIRHLPSIVGAAAAGGGRGAAAGGDATSDGFSFQKISGGLDAGVAIYSRRVDHTYKEAFQSLQGMDTRHGATAAQHKNGLEENNLCLKDM